MKLRNKKTGEIVDLLEIVRIDDISNEFYLRLSDNEGRTFKVGFNSLTELNEEWEDYDEEPKLYYYIAVDCEVMSKENKWFNEAQDEIGNRFETKEEAEKAVEKLKAWKRLKDKGFRITMQGCKGNAWLQANWGNLQGDYSDILLLFGGEDVNSLNS